MNIICFLPFITFLFWSMNFEFEWTPIFLQKKLFRSCGNIIWVKLVVRQIIFTTALDVLYSTYAVTNFRFDSMQRLNSNGWLDFQASATINQELFNKQLLNAILALAFFKMTSVVLARETRGRLANFCILSFLAEISTFSKSYLL